MKHFYIIMAALMMAGCTKSTETGLQTIQIGLEGVYMGDITKVQQTAIPPAITATMPKGSISFTLTSTKAAERTYNVALGESVTIPIDEYRVTAKYRPQEKARTYKNGIIYAEPRFNVDEVINVTNLQSEYNVDAVFDCWALVIDASQSKKYQQLGYSVEMEDFSWFTYTGDIGVAYIYGTWTTDAYRLTAYPKEEVGHEPKTYRIVTDRNYEGVYVENGKWYCFGPAEVEDASGAMGVNYPEWTEGATE